MRPFRGPRYHPRPQPGQLAPKSEEVHARSARSGRAAPESSTSCFVMPRVSNCSCAACRSKCRSCVLPNRVVPIWRGTRQGAGDRLLSKKFPCVSARASLRRASPAAGFAWEAALVGPASAQLRSRRRSLSPILGRKRNPCGRLERADGPRQAAAAARLALRFLPRSSARPRQEPPAVLAQPPEAPPPAPFSRLRPGRRDPRPRRKRQPHRGREAARLFPFLFLSAPRSWPKTTASAAWRGEP
jgi:hypothetical protein